MTDAYTPMTAQQRANVQGVIDALTEVGEAIGGWSAKFDCRQTGASYHAKFEKKVDVFTTAKWADQLGQCPAKLVNACERLLASDAAVASQKEGES